MALPSKKQLHKHRRGTRKALDTLDALNGEEQQAAVEEKPASGGKATSTQKSTSPKTKKSGKTPAKKKKTATKKVEKQVVQEVAKPEIDMQDEQAVSPVEPVAEPEPVVGGTGADEKTEAGRKGSISMDLSDPDGKINQKAENSPAAGDKKTDPETNPEKPGESSQFADLEEDTQKDRFLSFRIEKEDYGLEIKYVTEIIVMQKITEVPNTPEFIKGVINLRGKVIPVMDVRERFNLQTREYDDRTCIVVVKVSEMAVGLIVDTVNEVIDIPADQIDPPPKSLSGVDSNYICGLGKVGEQVKILLNAESILNLTQKNIN